MTLPNERANAIKYTHDFLRALIDPQKTPKVPKAIRQWAARCLRHYPGEYYLEELAKSSPDILEYEK